MPSPYSRPLEVLCNASIDLSDPLTPTNKKIVKALREWWPRMMDRVCTLPKLSPYSHELMEEIYVSRSGTSPRTPSDQKSRMSKKERILLALYRGLPALTLRSLRRYLGLFLALLARLSYLSSQYLVRAFEPDCSNSCATLETFHD